MAEMFSYEVIYILNCDEAGHDRKALAEINRSDPDANEFYSRGLGTVADARASARRYGWTVRRDKTATCPMCNARKRAALAKHKEGASTPNSWGKWERDQQKKERG